MYDSRITAASLIESVRAETDVSIDIPQSVYIRSINTVEQFVYSEILKEYNSYSVSLSDFPDDKIPLNGIIHPIGTDSVCFDDIIKVFAENDEISRAGVVGSIEFPEKQLYYNDYSGNIVLSLCDYPEKINIVYRLRPSIKTESGKENVSLPVEFLDMVCAKMRGEAYKIANEDGLAGKWLADYNTQLESFKIWAAKRNERYGW